MCRFALAPLLLLTALAARAQKPAQPTKDAVKPVTVEQLEQSLTETQGGADAELAQSLMRLELTERLSARRFTHLKEALPGEKSAQALLILTDRSEFLNPPKDEIVDQPVPDVAATRAMLVAIVNYVNTTQRQLPNLMATRETTGFEDRPAQDSLESTGIVSMSAMPLHQIASSTRVVTYRDRKEIVDEKASKGMKQGAPVEGLVTSGEFGPILSTVVADALKGAITWAHWEEGAAERNAVFHFSVPEGKSNYFVKFCCYVDGYQAGGEPELAVYNERAGLPRRYHLQSSRRIDLARLTPGRNAAHRPGCQRRYRDRIQRSRNRGKDLHLSEPKRVAPSGACGPAEPDVRQIELPGTGEDVLEQRSVQAIPPFWLRDAHSHFRRGACSKIATSGQFADRN